MINSDVKKIIDLTQEVMSSENTSRDKEYELTSILYDELISGKRERFDEIIKSTKDVSTALFLNSFVSNIASRKTFEKKDKGVVDSNLFAIPIISIQSKKDRESKISNDDLQAITNVLHDFNIIDDNLTAVFLQNIITPHAVFVDGFQINQFHDAIIMRGTGMNSAGLYPDIFGAINQDASLFPVEDETLVLRYIVGSFVGDNNKYFDNLDNIMQVFNLESFSERMNNILSKYFSEKVTTFMPLPYNEGVEFGVIEYNASAALHTFIHSIEQLGLDSSLIRLEIEPAEEKLIKLRLIDNSNHMLIAMYDWNIPYLTDTMMNNVMTAINEVCSDLGLGEYRIKQEDTPNTSHTMH